MTLRSVFLPGAAAVSAALVLLPAASVRADTLVVDNGHPRAADANPATRDAPLRTVSAAAKRAKPGDTVLVRPGIYREAVALTVSGKPGQPIVFRSEVPGKAVVSGADPVTGWRQEGPGIWSAAIPDLKFNRYGNAEWVYVDGSPLERAESRSRLLPGSFYLDFDPPQAVTGSLSAPAPQEGPPAVARRVFVAPDEGQDIASLKVELARREGLFYAAEPLDDIHILGFTIIHCADWARGKRAIVSVGPRWRIEDNHILWASYQGLATSRSNGTVVRNNRIEWCGDAAIGGGSNADLLVENNKFLYHNWRRFNPNHEGGISKWVYTVDSRIRGNEAGYYYGYGLWMDIANSGNVIENNIVHDSLLGASLFTEISWTDIIKDNISFNNPSGITIGESPGTAVLRNIVFNNDVGIRMRGNYGRRIGSNDSEVTAIEAFVGNLRRIPGLDPIRLEQAEAQYIIYWQSPQSHMSNNSVIWQNLLFDNRTNYTEHRNYAQQSPTDPFINNFSDHNVFWSTRPEGNVTHSGGAYADLAAWQKASGRDRHSVIADPRAPGTKLPEWAAAKRNLWDKKFRTPQEMQDLKLGLLDSAMAAITRGRIFRSASVRAVPVRDAGIKAFLFDVDGERILGIWTSQQGGRRYLRIDTDTGQRGTVTLENGYLAQRERRLGAGGRLDLPVSWVPTYVRGVGENVREVAGADLRAAGLSLPDRPIPLTASFVNDDTAPRKLTVTFSASPGFTPLLPTVSRTLKPGEKAEIKASLTPDGTFRRGLGQARAEATLGDERITRVASFSVGEGGGTLPFAKSSLVIDGDMKDWKALGDAVLTGVISEATQITGGEPGKWGGTKDLGARLYTAWGRDALYAAVVVTDDTVLSAPAGAAPWESDAVEFFIDGRASEMQWQQGFTEGVYQIGVGPAATPGGAPTVRVLGPSEMQGLVTASTRTADGYVIEMKIPLTARNFPAGDWQAGRSVKLSLLVDDRDDPNGPRKAVYGWSASREGRNHQDTSGWKTLLLEP